MFPALKTKNLNRLTLSTDAPASRFNDGGFFHGAKAAGIFFVCAIFFLSPRPVSAININGDFELSVERRDDPPLIAVRIAPKPDRLITGLSEDEAFITLTSDDIRIEGENRVFQTEYIREGSPKEFLFPFSPAPGVVDVTVAIHYVPCIESSGICKFPERTEQAFSLKKPGISFSHELIDTMILGLLLILGTAGFIVFLKYRKDYLFTIFIAIVFCGMLLYTAAATGGNSVTQADLSRSIAATLCLSCIGLELPDITPVVDPKATAPLAELAEPVHIVVFSAPWCGSCPAAKTYVETLCRRYPETLSFSVVDISLPEGKKELESYATSYPFREPLPLPAVIVSNNTRRVIYGTNYLEKNIVGAIREGGHDSTR
ncbi:MAG: thioredoxin family protein [Spirochaetales bacterium]|nr:thioredoxin family protein [Spirochaetales bacterium]